MSQKSTEESPENRVNGHLVDGQTDRQRDGQKDGEETYSPPDFTNRGLIRFICFARYCGNFEFITFLGEF